MSKLAHLYQKVDSLGMQRSSNVASSFAGKKKAGQALALSLLGRPRQRSSRSKQGTIDASKNAVAAALQNYVSGGRTQSAMKMPFSSVLQASKADSEGVPGSEAHPKLCFNHAFCAGAKEGGLADVWQELSDAEGLLALAPDDEVLAETFALQAELLQQVAINRARTASLLQLALQDVPDQLKATAQKQLGVDIAKAWIAVSLGLCLPT